MKLIRNRLLEYELNPILTDYLAAIIMILFIGILCIASNFISKKIVLRVITHIITNNKFDWDNILLERKVFHRLSHIVPAIIIYYFSSTFPDYQHLIEKGAITYIIVVGLRVINSFLKAFNDIYLTFEISKTKPIKGYIQVVQIIVFILGAIVIIANLMGRVLLFFSAGLVHYQLFF